MTPTDPTSLASLGTVGDTHVEIVPSLEARLQNVRELLSQKRMEEAEHLLQTVDGSEQKDARYLRLLALVHFKQSRLADAYQTYREAIQAEPEDPTLRFNAGLVALKLERFQDAVTELEESLRINPDEQRAYSYLGLAHGKLGQLAQAAVAFRRAGQHELAAEMERKVTRTSGEFPVMPKPPVAPGGDEVEKKARPMGAPGDAFLPPALPTPSPEIKREAIRPLTSFVTSCLLSLGDETATNVSFAEVGLRFAVSGGAHIRASGLWVAFSGPRMQVARRRVRGAFAGNPDVQNSDPFLKLEGEGECLLMPPQKDTPLICLALDQDILYLDETRVMAFSDSLVYESGRLPGQGKAFLQFRGAGQVVVACNPLDLGAIRVVEGDFLALAPERILGWVGRVVVQGEGPLEKNNGLIRYVTCEGEGVLLLSRYAEPR